MYCKLFHLVLSCLVGQWSSHICQLPIFPCLEVCVGGGGSRALQPVTKIIHIFPPLCAGVQGGLGGYIIGCRGPSGGGCNQNFVRDYPLFSRLWMWYSFHQLLLDIIFWSHGGNCFTPPTSMDFYLPIIPPRRDRRPALYSPNPLCIRLCFMRFMSTPPPPLTRTSTRKRMMRIIWRCWSICPTLTLVGWRRWVVWE